MQQPPFRLDYASPHQRPSSQRGIHLVLVVGASCVAIVINFAVAQAYGSIRGAEVFLGSAVLTLIAGLVALIAGLCIPATTWRGKAVLVAICLVPALFIAGVFVTGQLCRGLFLF